MSPPAEPIPSTSSPVPRFAVYYAAVFAVVGVNLPFWPVWLQWRGLEPTEIGLVISAGVWLKIVVHPLITQLADRWGRRKGLMVALSLGALGASALFLLAESFWALFAVAALTGMFFGPLMPLGENLTLLVAYERKLDYGRIRLWGSLSFIAAATGAGWLLAGRSPALILWLVLGALALAVLACLALPDAPTPPAGPRAATVRRLLRAPLFLLFLPAAGLIQASHGVYYGFATLHWRSLGYGDGLIGWLWAEGVLAEIVLFAVSGPLVRRLNPTHLLVCAGLAALVRWSVTAESEALGTLLAVQALHAVTFGLTHLGTMHFIARAVPPGLSATAQGLYSAVGMGAIFGLSMMLSGVLYGAHGAAAFHAMGVMALMGACLSLVLAWRWRGGLIATDAPLG